MTYKCLFSSSWSLVKVNDARKCQNCRYSHEKSFYLIITFNMIWSILYGPYPWYFQKSLLSSKFRENTFLPPTVNLSNIKTLYNTICRVTGVFIIVSNSKTNTGRYQKSAATIFPEIEYNSSKNNRSHPNKERIVRLTQTADFVRYFNTRSVSWIVPLLMKYMSSVYKKYIFDRLRKKL